MLNTDGKLVRQGDGRTGIDSGALACWYVRDELKIYCHKCIHCI